MSWLAIVPAAGSGSRLARGVPKALVTLAGRPLLARTLETTREVPFERVVVAGPPDRLEEIRPLLAASERIVKGGPSRAESVRLAFEALAPRPGDVVCVHDAARPFVTADEMRRVMAAAEKDGAAIAAMPIVDTVKRVKDGWIEGTADRAELWAAATPQAFREDVLRRALTAAPTVEATDEASLCERLGIRVAVVAVSRLAFKITTPEDLRLADAFQSDGVRR
jgi:2-C-methyl-D-erythritol 4-phosphate cytidylyltransferase